MSPQESLLLNTLAFVKEICLNAQQGITMPYEAHSQIIKEIDKTSEVYGQAAQYTKDAFGHSMASSFDALNNGNSVELRTVGKHKWLFVNNVHIARVEETRLTHGRNAITTFTAIFAVDKIKGFDIQ